MGAVAGAGALTTGSGAGAGAGVSSFTFLALASLEFKYFFKDCKYGLVRSRLLETTRLKSKELTSSEGSKVACLYSSSF